MNVREAEPDDAPSIQATARASWHAAYDDLLGAETVDTVVNRWYALDSLRDEISQVGGSDIGIFLVAVDDSGDEGDGATGTAVGYANAGPRRTPDDPADAFFSRLYIDPDHWGQGIGSTLAATVFEFLADAGHESVWLEVFESNDVGRSFYESLGFERVDSVEETFEGTTLTTLHLSASLSVLNNRDTEYQTRG